MAKSDTKKDQITTEIKKLSTVRRKTTTKKVKNDMDSRKNAPIGRKETTGLNIDNVVVMGEPVPPPEKKEFNLSDEQQLAYDEIMTAILDHQDKRTNPAIFQSLASEYAFTLSGYAGTGKTTLIAKLVDHLVTGLNVAVAVAAPTNKAVKVLREKIQVDGCAFGSIHKFLGLRLIEREDGTATCKPEGESTLTNYSVCIIDECSMIGPDMYQRILAASRCGCFIVFVGDIAQLPPVGEKELSPVFDQVPKQHALTEVVRQAKGNPIIKLSMAIRDAMQAGIRVNARTLANALPPANETSNACIVEGGVHTLTGWALHELQQGRDCRIIAFTNRRVLQFNRAIHESLHGFHDCPFAVGERVVIHTQTSAMTATRRAGEKAESVRLHTSAELDIVAIGDLVPHKWWPEFLCYEVVLWSDEYQCDVKVLLAAQPDQVQDAISRTFTEWREHKAASIAYQKKGDSNRAQEMRGKASAASKLGWAMTNGFAPLRHVYAITTHKSQGSTFDTALVDLEDLSLMKRTTDYNRALYVAVTRPRDYLAIVV